MKIFVKKTLRKKKKKYYANKRNNAKPCNINIGNKVIVRKRQKNKTLPYYDPNPYIVYGKESDMIVARRDGFKYRYLDYKQIQ